MKILNHFKENKIFYITFGMLMFVSFEYLVQKEVIHYLDNYYFPLYVINYDCGFCSRLLVGSVFSLFFGDTLDVLILNKFLLCFYIFVCFILSIFINNSLKNTKYDKTLGLYTFFIVISPVMLAYLRFLGTLDLFWLPFVILSFLVVDKKGWRWLVPFFCAVSLCLYELFVTTYLPVMAIIVFYQFVKKPSRANFIYIAVSAVVVGAATIYFLIIGDSTMKMTSDQMVEFARNRLDATGSTFDDFYLRSTFFWELPDVEKYSGFLGYIKYNFEIFTAGDASALKGIFFFAFSNTITAVPFLYMIAKSFRKADKPIKKFTYLCCFSTFAFMFVNLLLSTDTDRFSLHFLLASLLLLIFFVREKDVAFSESYDETLVKFGENKSVIIIVTLALSRIVLSGVRF
ncbi:MAG: hypothetical protein UH249_05730 [Acutalibacteraceae bacterium]|nr:hypothetical protein [Acutalibacteraceae bacterium]